MERTERSLASSMPVDTRAGDWEAVLFDLDGVLVDSEAVVARTLYDVLADAPLPFTRAELVARARGATFADLYARLELEFDWVRPADVGARGDAALATALLAVTEVAGARETLRTLRAAKVPFAVASNSRRDRLRLKLEAAGLTALVGDHAYDPSVVGGRGKPHPDLYRHAAAALGCDVARCVVVDDAVAGVISGVSAGAIVWAFCDPNEPGSDAELLVAAGASLVVRGHAELREMLGVAPRHVAHESVRHDPAR